MLSAAYYTGRLERRERPAEELRNAAATADLQLGRVEVTEQSLCPSESAEVAADAHEQAWWAKLDDLARQKDQVNLVSRMQSDG